MPLEVVVEDLSDEPRALPEEERAATEAQTQGKKKNLALECSFEEESALSPGPPPLERSRPIAAVSAKCQDEKVLGTRTKKLDAEERLQRKREAQRRYRMKKREQTLEDAWQRRHERSQSASGGPSQAKGLDHREAAVKEVAPQNRPPRKQKPPTEENVHDDAALPATLPVETKQESPQIAPPDIRLATPQLRSRALLRCNYEQRAHRFAGLLAEGLPR